MKTRDSALPHFADYGEYNFNSSGAIIVEADVNGDGTLDMVHQATLVLLLFIIAGISGRDNTGGKLPSFANSGVHQESLDGVICVSFIKKVIQYL